MSVLKRWNERDQVWEIIGMGTSQSAAEISAVTKISTKDPLYPDGKTGDVHLEAGDIEFDIASTYDSSSIGYRLQQTISSTSPLIATISTPYATINNALINGRVVYVDIEHVRYYFMKQGTTSGISWVKFIANTGSEINVITYNSDNTYTLNTRNSNSIFWATYGTTTAQEIISATNAGYLCVVRYNSNIYILHSYSDTTVYFITSSPASDYLTIREIWCQNTTWGNGSVDLPSGSQISTLQLNVSALETDVDTLQTQMASIGKIIYPVGAIYMSTSSTPPASLFGGSWAPITDKFLLAAGSTYTAGGSGGLSVVPLEAKHLPKITGTFRMRPGGDSGGTAIITQTSGVFSGGGNVEAVANGNKIDISGATGGNKNSQLISFNLGNNEKHENMPPYYTVYMWKRIS